MKNYIVVVKPGVNPNNEIAVSTNEGGMESQVLFKNLYDEDINEASLLAEEQNPRLKELKDEMSRTYTIKIDEKDEGNILQELKNNGLIETLEEDEENYQSFSPNDPKLPSLYGLRKMQVDTVWNNNIMGQDIIVAVVDSGIDIDHEDLKNNLWDDGNGNNGFNVINGGNDLTDESHHGTHVSGTIGAVVNNNTGVAGVAPLCKIMAIKGLQGPRGSGLASNLAKGIRKAVDNNARVINNSWGPGRSTEVHKAIEYAHLLNVVVVFAAGNDDITVSPQDAAGNQFVISVGATDDNDNKGSFSNHGQLVTVSAPGVDILSTVPGNNYDSLNGTSMASPHVAGLVALMFSKNNTLKPDQIKNLIVTNCDPFVPVPIVPMGSGRVNAAKTIAAI
jgi:subtilisin family serine protease